MVREVDSSGDKNGTSMAENESQKELEIRSPLREDQNVNASLESIQQENQEHEYSQDIDIPIVDCPFEPGTIAVEDLETRKFPFQMQILMKE